MKRIIKKIRNIFLSFGVLLLTTTQKVFAINDIYVVQPEYGVPSLSKYDRIIGIAGTCLRIIIIPTVFVIGALIYYFKKSKSSTKRKMIILAASLILAIALCIGTYYLEDYIIEIINK